MYIYRNIYIYIYISSSGCATGIYLPVSLSLIVSIKDYYRAIGKMVRVFANGAGPWVSIPGLVIAKTQKSFLMPPCLTLSILRYVSRVKSSNPGNRVVPSPTHRCSSY